MAKFSSTTLVASNTTEEIRKADLSLLEKINALADSISPTTTNADGTTSTVSQKSYDFSSGNVLQLSNETDIKTIILTGTLTSDRLFVLYVASNTTYNTKQYKIINQCVNTGSNNFKVTVTTNISGGLTADFFGLIASSVGYLSSDITCDGKNVYQDTNIIESGTNSNGSYIMYPDGTMICRNNYYFSLPALALNASDSTSIAPTFPVSFASACVVTCTFYAGYAENFGYKVKENGSNITGFGLYVVNQGPGATPAITGYLGYIAIGRWK